MNRKTQVGMATALCVIACTLFIILREDTKQYSELSEDTSIATMDLTVTEKLPITPLVKDEPTKSMPMDYFDFNEPGHVPEEKWDIDWEEIK